MISCIFYPVNRCNFYKQQRVGHYFNLHARAPSAEVPRWVDKRIDRLPLYPESNSVPRFGAGGKAGAAQMRGKPPGL